jgi:hypothetical protein
VTSSSWVPSPNSTRKRKSECGDSIRSKGLEEEFCELAGRRIRDVVRGSVLREISGRYRTKLEPPML